MTIRNLRLSTFKVLIKNLLDAARHNGTGNFKALKITYSWAKDETDEEIFELLKKGSGGKFIEKLLRGE